MAPIHHHYELKGLDETKIIVRFLIVFDFARGSVLSHAQTALAEPRFVLWNSVI